MNAGRSRDWPCIQLLTFSFALSRQHSEFGRLSALPNLARQLLEITKATLQNKKVFKSYEKCFKDDYNENS